MSFISRNMQYFFLNLFYTSYTVYRYGFKAWGKMVMTDGWKYFFLAAVDVEVSRSVIYRIRGRPC